MKIGDTIPDTYPFTQKITANKTVVLTAIPRFGYRFTGWSSGSVATTETISVTMTCGKEFIANFIPQTHKIITIVSPSPGGEIILKPTQPQDGYLLGTTVTIAAKPAHGFVFKEWTGTDLNTTENSFIYIVAADQAITAVFVEKPSNTWGWIIGGVGAGIIIFGALLYIFVFKKRQSL